MTDLPARFTAVMDGLAQEGRPLAVAVSGGADSMALCLLSAGWAQKRGCALLALTVDHGLRAESADEAVQVHAWLGARGIDHEILQWRGAKPATGVQAAAREARYRLLKEACSRHGITNLLLGHHAGDQAETVLMRLFHGSGPHGLAGMAMRHAYEDGLVMLRPLLEVRRREIEEYLRSRRQPWIEDPSNRDYRYERVRIRGAIADWGGEALVGRLSRLSRRLWGQRDAINWAVARAIDEGASLHAAGYALLDAAYWRDLPPFLGEEVLMHLAETFSGDSAPAALPRRRRFEQLCRKLHGREGFSGSNIGGAEIRSHVHEGRDCLLVCRERGRGLPVLNLRPGDEGLWDRRFLFRFARTDEPLNVTVRALGDDMATLPEPAREFVRGQPAPVRPVLPVFWLGDICLGLPFKGTFRQGFDHILAMFDVEFIPLRRIFAK